ncbi:MAG: phosphoribosylglycinamide formyltransferase [Planctomycetes bacterium]|nr:phosphoribosylglycinamide formyltransferase [Planctomycetota bacterium]
MSIRLAVLFSGGGTTILNLLDRIEDGTLDAEIVLAVASRNDITGIDRLADRNIEVAVAKQEGDSDKIIDEKIQAWLQDTQPDLILLCGYLRLLPIESWMQGRVLNIHPSLLPDFGGKGMFGIHVHEAVMKSGNCESGCTVHYVDDEYDHGPMLIQKTCTISDDDTPQTLASKVFALECLAYPEAIKKAAKKVTV